MNTQSVFRFVLSVLCLTVVAMSPATAQKPAFVQHGVLFLPPDFYHDHREELGLNENQLREMQHIAEESFKRSKDLEVEMKKRAEALHDVLAKHPANPDEAAQRLRQVLEIEDQLKAMQLHAKVAIRNLLNAEQHEKLKHLIAKSQAGKGDHATVSLKEKFERLKHEIKRRIGDNEPPRELVEQLERIERAARDGRVKEAEEQVDAMLRRMHEKDGQQRGKGELEQHMRRIAEAAERTDNPEVREKLQGALRKLREAAASGNHEVIGDILRAIKPHLGGPGQKP
jgi:hypothetical protein